MSPTKQLIVTFLEQNPQTSVVRLIDEFSISKQAMHRHLKELIEQGEIHKQGLPPKVYYSIKPKSSIKHNHTFNSSLLSDFVTINAVGIKKEGIDAFEEWCEERGYNINQYYQIYTEIKQKYDNYYNNIGLIDATQKVKNTFGSDCYIDNCFYSSFSAIEIFGKTGVYAQMLYAKQSGNKQNMRDIFPQFVDNIKQLMTTYRIQAIGFVPPTVPRKIQLMKEFEKFLDIALPKVTIQKIHNQYLVPQKTLSKPKERQHNAQETFVVEYTPSVDNILLIDDFVGSGSSFNYIAKKIKAKHSNCSITCFAISGTPNGVINNNTKNFEVINEA